MTEHTAVPERAPDNRELFARLRGMWSALDPMPAGLIDDILVRIATDGLMIEYALLTLVSESDELVGVRGGADARTLEFSDGETTLLLRVSSAGPGRRRIDGWLAPAAVATIRLDGPAGELTTDSDADGRFVLADLPEGRARIWLDRVADGGAGGFTTLEFEL